jgi:hypothetical protein
MVGKEWLGAIFKPLGGYVPVKYAIHDVGGLSLTQSGSIGERVAQLRVDGFYGDLCTSVSTLFSNQSATWTNARVGANGAVGELILVSNGSGWSASFTSLEGASVAVDVAVVGKSVQTVYAAVDVEGAVAGDIVVIKVEPVWRRVGIFNTRMDGGAQFLSFESKLKLCGVRMVPTLMEGAGAWVVSSFDIKAEPATSIRNVEDDFFRENRNRQYSKEPVALKAHYSLSEGSFALAKIGIEMTDVYSFTVSFADVVRKIGRPLVIGDVVELVPEMRYDERLRPVKKFLEIKKTGWASDGYTPSWTPVLMQFDAEPAIPSQETQDVFGSLALASRDTVGDGVASPINTTGVSGSETLKASVDQMVPEMGLDLKAAVGEVELRVADWQKVLQSDKLPKRECTGLPPNGELYTEGFSLPAKNTVANGAYHRLNYPVVPGVAPQPPALYRFNARKQMWVFVECDERMSVGGFVDKKGE